jgi:hypothetical protein
VNRSFAVTVHDKHRDETTEIDIAVARDVRHAIEQALDSLDDVRVAYDSPATFYNRSPERRRSPERDLGADWTSGEPGPVIDYRCSWVERTGEVYCVRVDGHSCQVRVLGRLAAVDFPALDAKIQEWRYRTSLPAFVRRMMTLRNLTAEIEALASVRPAE